MFPEFVCQKVRQLRADLGIATMATPTGVSVR